MVIGPKKSGFVLLVVLVVLAIAATVLAATARRCGSRAMAAGEMAREIQLRWGTISLKNLCLNSAGSLLNSTTADDGPARRIGKSLDLGGVRFQLVIADEGAKANVNLLAAQKTIGDLEPALMDLQADCRRVLPVVLRPVAPAGGRISALPMRYISLSQVLGFKHPAELIDPQSQEPSASDRLTCWGNGLVNFKTAPRQILRAVAGEVLSEGYIEKLRKLVAQKPTCSLAEAIKHLELNDDRAKKVRDLLTDRSSCFSLWVIADDGSRTWHRLYVRSSADTRNDREDWTFQW